MTTTMSIVINIDENRSLRLSTFTPGGLINLALLYKGEVQAGIDLRSDSFDELKLAVERIHDLLDTNVLE